jgi:hypothetical protein
MIARLRTQKPQRTVEDKQEAVRLATATTLAADIYGTLPLELRLSALCLPFPEIRMAA